MVHGDGRDFPRAVRRLKWWGAALVGIVLMPVIEISRLLLMTHYFGPPTVPNIGPEPILIMKMIGLGFGAVVVGFPMAVAGFAYAWMSKRWWISLVCAAAVEFPWTLIEWYVSGVLEGPASLAARWLYLSLIYLFGWCLAWMSTPSNWWPRRQPEARSGVLRTPDHAADPLGGLSRADDALIQAEKLSERTGPPQRRVLYAVIAGVIIVIGGYFGWYSTAADDNQLAVAAIKGEVGTVRELLRRGHSPDAGELMGLSALYYAVGAGEIEVVKVLLDAGADPNRHSGPAQRTPIQHAARNRQLEIARLLLERGADPNRPNMFGRTALYHLRDEEPPLKAPDKKGRLASREDMAALIREFGGRE